MALTEKELHKLKRQDFLQLLLTQGQEVASLQARLYETTEALDEMTQMSERLKAKLNEKDELIEKLKGRLDQKDATIRQLRSEMEAQRESRRIELERAGSIAKAALSLNGVFEAAQKAADQYLYSVKMMYGDMPEGATIPKVRRAKVFPRKHRVTKACRAKCLKTKLMRLCRMRITLRHDVVKKTTSEETSEN